MSKISNEEIINRYLEHYSHSKISQSTRKYALEYFFRSKYFNFNGHAFSIVKSDIIDYFDYLNHLNNISLQTKQNKWAIFNSFLKFMVLYYDDNSIVIPQNFLKWSPIHKKPFSNKNVILSVEELKQILAYNFNHHYQYYIIFRFFTETGMRVGEFLSINYDNIDLKKRIVETRGKTGIKIYYFSIGLVKHLKIFLKERALREVNSNALFLSSQGKRMSAKVINRQLRECVQRLHIQKWITCHTFRRTLNTLRKKMGCPREERKVLLCQEISDVNLQSYVIYNYDDFIQMFDKWNPYISIFE